MDAEHPPYTPPAIVYEVALEVRAGSPIPNPFEEMLP